MKKVISVLIAVLLIASILPMTAFAAGSITVSTGKIELKPGASGTFNIVANNAAGRVDISSSDTSVASVSTSSVFVDSGSGTATYPVSVKANKVGTTVITVTCTDQTMTFDKEPLAGSYSITVVVAEPATTTTTKAPSTTKAPKPTDNFAANKPYYKGNNATNNYDNIFTT